jgi:hypothetical protein
MYILLDFNGVNYLQIFRGWGLLVSCLLFVLVHVNMYVLTTRKRICEGLAPFILKLDTGWK